MLFRVFSPEKLADLTFETAFHPLGVDRFGYIPALQGTQGGRSHGGSSPHLGLASKIRTGGGNVIEQKHTEETGHHQRFKQSIFPGGCQFRISGQYSWQDAARTRVASAICVRNRPALYS